MFYNIKLWWNKRWKFAIVAPIFVFASFFMLNQSVKADASLFSGTLLTGLQQPDAGATINLLSGGAVAATAITAADGTFSITADPGLYGFSVVEQSIPASDNIFSINSETGSNPSDAVIDLSAGSIVQNITLPLLTSLKTTSVDALGSSLKGTTVKSGPVNASLALWQGGPMLDVSLMSSTSQSFFGVCQSDISGVCLIETFIGANPTSLTDSNTIGQSAQVQSPAIVDSTATASIQLSNYVLLDSAGAKAGKITASTPNGTQLTAITTAPVPGGNTTASGATIQSGVISYHINNVLPGSSITEMIIMPVNGYTSNIYSIKNGTLTDITAQSSIWGYLVNVTITDGGPGDNDGIVNGIIDQSLVIVKNNPSNTPTNVVASAGNASAKLSWSAPNVNGGTAITGYQVIPYKAGIVQPAITFNSTSTTQTITNLTNAANYTFTVIAVNGAGQSIASNQSNSVTVGIPLAPTSVLASPGSSSANISFTAPIGDSSAPTIISYVVTPYIGLTAKPSKVFPASSTNLVFNGLVNGASYSFKVAAQSASGQGPQSAASAAVIVGVPTSPTNLTSTAGNASAALSWTAPSSSNGAAVTSYIVTPYLNNVAQTPTLFKNNLTNQTITGLLNSKIYSFTVIAKNSYGNSAASPQTAVITIGVPIAPTLQQSSALTASAKVSWVAPTINNGAAITGYVITPYLSGVAESPIVFAQTNTTQIINNLIANKTYTFTVAAQNINGIGLVSTFTNNVTPTAYTTSWNSLDTWTDSWDAKDAVSYTPTIIDQANYGIDTRPRVDSIINRGSDTLPMLRDQGEYSSVNNLPANLPGALYVANSPFFGGRPALNFDLLPIHNNFHSMISPVTNFTDTSKWFNPPTGYNPPYWVAVLGDGQDGTLGNLGTGPTFGDQTPTPTGNWSVSCWNNSYPGMSIVSSTKVDSSNTVLILYYNSGSGAAAKDSFLEINYRASNGQLVTQRTYGNQNNYSFKELFMGWVDGQAYWSGTGIKTGTPSETELSNVRAWSTSFIPQGGQGG